ncbi:MAG TPA: hypothetical protein VH619_09755 [Verrucomicrobiae bacterium]|jgi:hypothetical protein|nr:hypothetical protein [Verrucomicrobiae bacterium]
MSANPARDHERRDVHAKWVVVVVAGLFVFGMCLHVIIAGFMASLNRAPSSSDAWDPPGPTTLANPTFPVLQVSAPLDLQDFRRSEEARLSSYGWINRTAGIVRIPIEEAMNLVLQEGLPVRSATNKNAPGPSSYQLIQQRSEHRQPEIQGNP